MLSNILVTPQEFKAAMDYLDNINGRPNNFSKTLLAVSLIIKVYITHILKKNVNMKTTSLCPVVKDNRISSMSKILPNIFHNGARSFISRL